MTHTISSASSGQRTRSEGTRSSGSFDALIALFIVSILMPISLEIAGVRLTPARIFLLVSIVPLGAQVIAGKVGRFTMVDLLFLLHGIWILIALIAVHGAERIPFAGITAVELIGGYFVGRCFVRDAASYRRVFKYVLIALACLMPFALYESLTGKMVIPDLLRPVFETPTRSQSAYGRMGLERVYAVFDHPILWGLFCCLTLANFRILAGGSNFKKLIFVGISLLGTFLSLSSAPLLACAIQIGLLLWERVIKGKWKMLIILSITGYVVIDLLSNRTPVTIIIETLTFNSGTGWIRIAIFDYGWVAAKGSPVFGIGFNDWYRPPWLTPSVDNFWLLTAMRYGMVGAFFIIAAFLTHAIFISKTVMTRPIDVRLRSGYLIAFFSIFFVLVTVHIWGAMAIFTMFYVGSGAWMYVFPQTDDEAAEEVQDVPLASRYSRFGSPHVRGGNVPSFVERR